MEFARLPLTPDWLLNEIGEWGRLTGAISGGPGRDVKLRSELVVRVRPTSATGSGEETSLDTSEISVNCLELEVMTLVV